MLKRHSENPVIKRQDIKATVPHLRDVTSVFNPGAIKFGELYLLLLRVQNRGRETYVVKATGHDGIHFSAENKEVIFEGIEKITEPVYHVYDPRISFIDGVYYIMVAMDMDNRCALGLARTTDFEKYTFMGITDEHDVRNGVLFPEKVGGRYLRMERPNKVQLSGGPTSGREIILSESDDLLRWKPVKSLITGRFHYWDETIGSGPPPVKTRQGWLHLYHGIAHHFGASNIYQGGAILLDLHDPSIVLARTRYNILEPRELYELAGQVPNVVFPSGMIVEEYDAEGFAKPESEAKIYYGAADTVVGLATATVQELIDACYNR